MTIITNEDFKYGGANSETISKLTTPKQAIFIQKLLQEKEGAFELVYKYTTPSNDLIITKQEASKLIEELLLLLPNKSNAAKYFTWYYNKIVRAANSESDKWREFRLFLINNGVSVGRKNLQNYEDKKELIYNEYARISGKRVF